MESNAKRIPIRFTVWLTWLLFLICIAGMAQNNYTLNGMITDKNNGETLFGTSVFLTGTTIGVVTNEYGFYSITAPESRYTLNISYLGYTDINQEIDLNSNQKIDFELAEFSTELQEVVVEADEPERVLLGKPEMSMAKMNIPTVKQMPVVLGEVSI